MGALSSRGFKKGRHGGQPVVLLADASFHEVEVGGGLQSNAEDRGPLPPLATFALPKRGADRGRDASAPDLVGVSCGSINSRGVTPRMRTQAQRGSTAP